MISPLASRREEERERESWVEGEDFDLVYTRNMHETKIKPGNEIVRLGQTDAAHGIFFVAKINKKSEKLF